MKAKEWYNVIKECKAPEEMKQKLDDCMRSLITDAVKMVKQRNCKTIGAAAAAIKDQDRKWKAIVSLHNKTCDSLESNIAIKYVVLDKNGFKKSFIANYPEFEEVFHLDEPNTIQQETKKEEKPIFFFKPTPYEELTQENLISEIMGCIHAVSVYVTDMGMKPEHVRPLINRVSLLKYWHNKGKINLNDLEEFQKDENKWVREHQF